MKLIVTFNNAIVDLNDVARTNVSARREHENGLIETTSCGPAHLPPIPDDAMFSLYEAVLKAARDFCANLYKTTGPGIKGPDA